MAASFPTTIASLTNPASTDYINSPSHFTQHTNANDEIEALEAKVGVDNSAVTTSHDYKLTQIETVKARAYLGDSQSIPNNAWTTVQLNTENFDIGSDFDVTTFTFTAPVDGYYLIIGNVSYSTTTATANYKTGIYKGASVIAQAGVAAGGTKGVITNVSTIESLSADDTILLRTYQDQGSARNIDNARGSTFMAIHLLALA